jgi:hypothetical protein
MADMNILQQGDKVKYIITSQNPNLDMEVCDFYVELIYGMRAEEVTIQKSEMLYGTDGEFVMIFDTSKLIGKITARFVWYAIDTDIDPNNRRQEVDEQVVVFVVDTPNPKLFCCPANSGEHDVHYQMTDEPDIAAKYLRLCATETVIPDHGEPYIIYRPLITRNDEYIYVLREVAEQLNINN